MNRGSKIVRLSGARSIVARSIVARSIVALPAVAVLAGAGLVFGTAAPSSAAPAYPKAVGRCVDRTTTLGTALCKKITAILLADEKRSSDEIAVAVVPTTGGASIEKWSTGLFNAWGVGKKDANNGVLLVVALDDHRVRLETGRGISDRLGAATTKQIIDNAITPRFTEHAYAAGILNGLDEVRRALGHAVPATALLSILAPPAPADTAPADTAPAQVDDSGGGSLSGVMGSDPNFASEDSSPGSFWDEHPLFGILALVLGGGVVLILLSVFTIVGAATRLTKAGRGTSIPTHPRRPMRHHSYRDTSSQNNDMTAWTAASSFSAGSSFSSNDSGSGFSSGNSGSGFSSGDSGSGFSSGDSGSSFGGGSSDGGGSSGSW